MLWLLFYVIGINTGIWMVGAIKIIIHLIAKL